jgi:hypothetical protein
MGISYSSGAYKQMTNLYRSVYTSAVDFDTIINRVVRTPVNCMSVEDGEAVIEKKVDRKLVSFRLPEDLLESLRSKADYSGISVTELVCRLLRQGLAEENTDDRIVALENELRDLRQRIKQPSTSNNVTHALLYPLQSQTPATYEAPSGLEQRMDKLEALISVLTDRMTGQHSETHTDTK